MNKDEILISVIVPFFNEEEYLFEAINSLIKQTYQNIEILLIDDNSTDNSAEVCNKFKDSRIRYLKKEVNHRGIVSSRNLGIKEALGSIITFLDADDICHPQRIEKQFTALIQNGIQNTICGTWVIKKGIQNTRMAPPVYHADIIKGFKRLFNRTTIIAGTIMGHKSLFQEVQYREKFKYFEDWDLLIRMYETNRIKFINLPEYLYTYNIRIKGTKFQNDWLNFNIFLRNCQERRQRNLNEFNSPEEMFDKLRRSQRLTYLYYILLLNAIKLKRSLKI